MVKQAAHDSSDECSSHSGLRVRVLEMVDRVNLKFTDESRERSSRSSDNLIFYILFRIYKHN